VSGEVFLYAKIHYTPTSPRRIKITDDGRNMRGVCKMASDMHHYVIEERTEE